MQPIRGYPGPQISSHTLCPSLKRRPSLTLWTALGPFPAIFLAFLWLFSGLFLSRVKRGAVVCKFRSPQLRCLYVSINETVSICGGALGLFPQGTRETVSSLGTFALPEAG